MSLKIDNCTQEPDPSISSAQVALFALQGCLDADLSSTLQLVEYALLPDAAKLTKDEMIRRLARLQKPAWLDGRIAGGRLEVEAGPLATRPDVMIRYQTWQSLSTQDDLLGVRGARRTTKELHVLCITQSAGLRVRLKDFQLYDRDYYLARPFAYGISPAHGLYRLVIGLPFKQSAGLSHIVRISSGGKAHIVIHYHS